MTCMYTLRYPSDGFQYLFDATLQNLIVRKNAKCIHFWGVCIDVLLVIAYFNITDGQITFLSHNAKFSLLSWKAEELIFLSYKRVTKFSLLLSSFLQCVSTHLDLTSLWCYFWCCHGKPQGNLPYNFLCSNISEHKERFYV